jgi:glycosidase
MAPLRRAGFAVLASVAALLAPVRALTPDEWRNRTI